MLIGEYYGGLEIHREEKIVVARLKHPHLVLSSGHLNGGMRGDIDCVFNHQACEPFDHADHIDEAYSKHPGAYIESICEKHSLEPSRCVGLGTAANMNNTAIVREVFRELEVVALCTAGVKSNAGRAGDPADYFEKDGCFEKVGDCGTGAGPGTIIIMLFVNQQLSDGALTNAVATATEGKIAALQELAINSRYSDGLATGTGTDQLAVACMKTDSAPLTGSQKHTKLGELIGRAVNNAVKKALAMQNTLTPESQRSVRIHIERLGITKEEMIASIEELLGDKNGKLFRANFVEIDKDPMTVAAVAALVHLRDKITCGIIPETCAPEILVSYGAQVAAAVSGKYEKIADYSAELGKEKTVIANDSFLNLLLRAIAVGFIDKWI